MIVAIAILGPTGVGKSALGLRIASSLNGEIVSIDSRQAYRHIDIGTAKPSMEEMRAIPHHMIDILELHEKNDAQSYARRASACIEDVRNRGKIPLLVGGSGFYFRAISEGLFHVEIDEAARRNFYESIKDVSTSQLYERLKSVDRKTHGRINQNDRYRISRALEVFELTGIPLSKHFEKQKRESERGRSFLKIGLSLPREKLYERINERTIAMLEGGWIEEAEVLLKNGAETQWPGLKTLGYPEVISYIKGELSFDELIEKVSRLTRQYAKRQMTWFRKEKEVNWIDAGDEKLLKKALAIIAAHFETES